MAMEVHDRWGAHLEYFKLSIALTTALIAAAAAIYVDDSKIPTDDSRFLLLSGVGLFVVTLICSIIGVARLGNHLINFPADLATASQTERDNATTRSRKVTWWANKSFFFLLASAVVLGAFFGFRTFQIGKASYERAIAIATSVNGALLDASKNETAHLKSLDLQADNYQMTFQINPGPGTTTIITNSAGTKLTSAHRQ